VRLLATGLAALALGSPASYLQGRQQAGGGFAEPGQAPTPGLTAWAAIGLRAAGADARDAHAYLVAHEGGLENATDVELAAIAEQVTGGVSSALAARARAAAAAPPTLNAAAWGILALRQLGDAAPPAAVRLLIAHQDRSGGWSWSAGSAPDSNDTAAAIQALRTAGVGRAPVARGLDYLRRRETRDGGFELTAGRGSDAQSTAWAVQAFRAAGVAPPPAALRYLARLRRPDGSYRYSARYAVTPVWVTAQVLASARPLPLRLAAPA
jgi:hypothetical protein